MGKTLKEMIMEMEESERNEFAKRKVVDWAISEGISYLTEELIVRGLKKLGIYISGVVVFVISELVNAPPAY